MMSVAPIIREDDTTNKQREYKTFCLLCRETTKSDILGKQSKYNVHIGYNVQKQYGIAFVFSGQLLHI